MNPCPDTVAVAESTNGHCRVTIRLDPADRDEFTECVRHWSGTWSATTWAGFGAVGRGSADHRLPVVCCTAKAKGREVLAGSYPREPGLRAAGS